MTISRFRVSRTSIFQTDVKEEMKSDILHNGEVSVKPEAPWMEIRDEDESNLTWEKGFEDFKHSKFNILQFPFLSSSALIGKTLEKRFHFLIFLSFSILVCLLFRKMINGNQPNHSIKLAFISLVCSSFLFFFGVVRKRSFASCFTFAFLHHSSSTGER